jgi:hypothetical protein
MQKERHFSRFRLDLVNEQLWQGEEEIRLRGKTFQVLRYLVARPGQLVTKDALLDGSGEKWPCPIRCPRFASLNCARPSGTTPKLRV